MSSLTLRDVRKSYGATDVMHGVDLDIKDGEFIVFVGPSGCGKSTLLRMIAGLEEISGGTITIGDQVVNEVAASKRGVAMVFQNYALYPHMSVYKNMAFGLKQAKTDPAEIDRRVRTAADLLQITDYLDRSPRNLSGGQRQRVAIGRAIVRDPKVFLFDEPLSNLDAALRVQTRLEIARLHKRLMEKDPLTDSESKLFDALQSLKQVVDSEILQNANVLENESFVEKLMLRLVINELKNKHELPLDAERSLEINRLIVKEYMNEYFGHVA
jgi:ABC-type Fe3+/spermidine/putrescine transport system ATPase subunit